MLNDFGWIVHVKGDVSPVVIDVDQRRCENIRHPVMSLLMFWFSKRERYAKSHAHPNLRF
jgi:hypothetical protein